MEIVKKIYLFVIAVLLSVELQGQQEPIYSQYMFNGFLINPAIAGAEGFTALNLTAREQWLGMANAPGTYVLSGQTRLTRTNPISKILTFRKRGRVRRPSGRVGLGTYVYNDMNGAIRKTGVQLAYAYHLFINNSQLSFGLSGSVFNFKANVTQEDLSDNVGDPLITGSNSMWVPDANFGVYYTSFNYYAGFSVSHLLESAVRFNDKSNGQYKMLRNYYLTGGYRFDLKKDYELEPSILIKSTENLLVQADINVKGYYKTDYWAGLSYRSNSSLVVMLGFKFDKYHFGYAFDWSFRQISKYSLGSHEFMAGIKFGDTRRRYRWLNRF